MTTARRRGGGFTLLEVLVAFTVLGVLLGAAMRIFAGGLGAVARDSDHARAVLLAQSRLAAIEAAVDAPRDGDHGMFDERFGWRLRLSRWRTDPPAEPAGGVEPALATLEVYWDDGGTERAIALDTVLLEH